MPRKTRKDALATQKSTLGNFFKITSASPPPSNAQEPKQQTLNAFFGKTEPADDIKGEESIPIVLIVSDDDDDDLIDPDSIFGDTTQSTTPVRREGLRSCIHSSSVSHTVENGKQGAISKNAPTSGSVYRNSLKSLVHASAQRKYDLGFLDKHMEKQTGMLDTDSDSDDALNGKNESGNEGVTLCLSNINESELEGEAKVEDIKRIKAQLNVVMEAKRSPLNFLVFDISENQSHLLREDYMFESIAFDTGDSVDRLFKEHRGNGHFFRQLISSHWIQAQAYRGWKLTQGVGDVLLQVVCYVEDMQTVHCGFQALCLFHELQHSSWRLDVATLKLLVERMHGKKRDCVVSFESEEELEDLERRQSLPAVYIEIERKPPNGHKNSDFEQANAERISFLMQIAALALDLTSSIEDICWAVCTFVDCILEHRFSLYTVHMQRSLASIIERIAPESKWSLVWAECVTRIGQQLSHLCLPALLRVVESLPMSSNRCMKLRHSLAFLFLRLQTSDMAMADEIPIMDKLIIAATLPGQIVLRVVGEMMDTSETLFRIDGNTDFRNIEAAVGLLGHVLDNVQALHDVKDGAREIYKRLGQMNRMINDSMASRIDKTRAKDAIQTLLVRVHVTAIADAKERVGMMYSSNSDVHGATIKTLDRYFKEPRVL
ncbi:hypothetical protein EV175_003173 [Coemansia sp. RSA 1933]|nr:hypothetical protein EV175_003173 [Coemansia sp. RSA 1933]